MELQGIDPDSNNNVYFVLKQTIKSVDLGDIEKGTIAYQVNEGDGEHAYELGDGNYSYMEKESIENNQKWERIDYKDVIKTWYKGDLQK